jgi:hypothetical protein
MPAFLSDDQIEAFLDSLWGSGTPVTWYVALFTVAPGTDGQGGTEASYTDYARASSTNDGTEWPAAAARVKSNANPIDFGVAGSGPSTIVGFGFYDDPTSTLEVHFFAYVPVTGGSVVVNNGADVIFQTGSIDLTGCALS